MQVSEKLRKNETVMDQVQNNSREQALMADLPQAANAAIVEALSSHNAMATRLLSDEQTRDVFVALLYEILKGGFQKQQ
jgi:type I restriction enzyme R subunit